MKDAKYCRCRDLASRRLNARLPRLLATEPNSMQQVAKMKSACEIPSWRSRKMSNKARPAPATSDSAADNVSEMNIHRLRWTLFSLCEIRTSDAQFRNAALTPRSSVCIAAPTVVRIARSPKACVSRFRRAQPRKSRFATTPAASPITRMATTCPRPVRRSVVNNIACRHSCDGNGPLLESALKLPPTHARRSEWRTASFALPVGPGAEMMTTGAPRIAERCRRQRCLLARPANTSAYFSAWRALAR